MGSTAAQAFNFQFSPFNLYHLRRNGVRCSNGNPSTFLHAHSFRRNGRSPCRLLGSVRRNDDRVTIRDLEVSTSRQNRTTPLFDIALSLLYRNRLRKALSLLDHYGSAEEAWSAIDEPDKAVCLDRAKKELDWILAHGIRVWTLEDEAIHIAFASAPTNR